MSGLTVLSVFPAMSNIHGDAGNAAVLATRARWRGVVARVLELAPGDPAPPDHPHAVVIGSGFDSEARATLEALRRIAEPLRTWVAAGVPLLAVGLGWELLSATAEVEAGSVLEGIGIFPGRAVPANRATGDILVESAFGPLIGYEYHVRDYLPAPGETPLGTVTSGIGNRPGAGVEGSIAGSAVGTHLRGPVLARNPQFADHLLGLAAARAEVTLGDAAEELHAVDAWADSANARTRHLLRRRG